jgi:2-phospho-L-lactate guanylyltransferase (CobY/MobA/RfbA family)
MTTVAVLADPPREGFVLPALADRTTLSTTQIARLYAASLSDVLSAVEISGADLLVNYRPEESIPAEYAGEESAERELRRLAGDVLSEPEATRFEIQVGTTVSGRAGNTATHLLESEDIASVAIVPGTAPLLGRTDIDGAAMKLRGSETVLGPAVGGGVYYAGFRAPIDFENAYDPPAIETLTDRALAADHAVDFMPMSPTIGTPAGLASAISLCRARERAGRLVPTRFAECLADLGLRTRAGESGLEVVIE